jgi:putative salt-induced outer membrane protein YdiY
VLAASAVFAADKEEKKSPWETSAELGYVETSGNTNTETFVFKFDSTYEIEKWKHQAHFGGLNSKAENITTANKYLIAAQSDYKFTPRDYFLGNVSYENDKFSGYQYQFKLSVGYGRKVLDLQKHKLDAEIGPGYRNFKQDDATSSEDEALLRLAAKYKWSISDNSEFKQDFFVFIGEIQDEWRSITSLKSNINKTLAMKLTYTVRYLDVVPFDPVTGSFVNNYERETAVTLVYTF